MRRGDQRSAINGRCDTDNIGRVHTRAVESIYDGLGMPDQALVSPGHFKRRSEDAVTPLFQFVDEQLPTFGPLSASVNETIRGHGWEHNCPQNDAVRQAQADRRESPKPESITKTGAEIT